MKETGNLTSTKPENKTINQLPSAGDRMWYLTNKGFTQGTVIEVEYNQALVKPKGDVFKQSKASDAKVVVKSKIRVVTDSEWDNGQIGDWKRTEEVFKDVDGLITYYKKLSN